ncbi:MAG: hypothetical protein ACI4WX_10120 [Aristaeellaceae bacterium]
MTIQKVLDEIDECKPNAFSRERKIAWLNETEHQVVEEILKLHEGWPEEAVFEGYDDDTPDDTVLLVPDAYAEIYHHALARKMDLKNGELDKYQNNTLLFNAMYQAFSDFWTRTHMPMNRGGQFRL